MKITIEAPYWLDYLRRVNQVYHHLETQSAQQAADMAVAIYLRVSTEEQATEGYSIDEQKRECLAFVQRHNWQIYNIYVDEGFSGTNDHRPAFQRLLKDGQAGKFQGVVTHKIDRTYRNAQSMLRTFSEWRRQGIFFASVNEQIDFLTPWGKLILGLLSLLAEVFVDNLRQETTKGKKGRFHKGLHNGPIPWGYCNGHCLQCTDANGQGYCPRFGLMDLHHGKHAVPHPVDSIAFREAHQRYRTSHYTDKEIAEFLNTYQIEWSPGEFMQVRSKGKPGQTPGVFTKDMVRDILQNPFYAGIVPYYGSVYDGEKVLKYTRPQDISHGQHVALISQNEFEQGLQIRAAKGKAPQGGRGQSKPAVRQAARVYVLQGLLDCHRCGAPLGSQAGGGNTRRHVCSTRIQRKEGCDQSSVKADILEAELATQVARIHLPQAWCETIIGYLLHEDGLTALMAQRQALQEHFNFIQELYHREEISRQSYRREWLAYERDMAHLSLEAHTNFDLNQARTLLGNFAALWAHMTPLEQKTMTQTLLQQAVVEDQHIIEWCWYTPFLALFPEDSI